MLSTNIRVTVKTQIAQISLGMELAMEYISTPRDTPDPPLVILVPTFWENQGVDRFDQNGTKN